MTEKPIKRILDESESKNSPWIIWNAFIDLVSSEDYKDLSSKQRLAHLAFWYDSEIQNGGHHQFFLNEAGKRAKETILALNELGLESHAKVLSKAIALRDQLQIPSPDTVEEFVDDALEDRFEQLDIDYYACEPEISVFLEDYLESNQGDFILFR